MDSRKRTLVHDALMATKSDETVSSKQGAVKKQTTWYELKKLNYQFKEEKEITSLIGIEAPSSI